MGALCKLVDAIVLLMFMPDLVLGPLYALPDTIQPEVVVRWRTWFAVEYQDYLMQEQPHFLVALIWLAIVFQWPIALLSLYGWLTSKPWFKTTCLIYGASKLTSMAAVLGEMLGSKKASATMWLMYSPCMAFGVLILLRGLLPHSCKAAAPTATIANRGTTVAGKKRL